MMKCAKNNLDEMQEQKLLKIEHNGAWFTFWGLLMAILVQVIIGGENLLRNIAGEWIVFMCLAGYMVYACIKNGIWDRRLKPNTKTNIVASLIAGIACGVVFSIPSYIKYEKLLGSICTGAFIFIFTFLSVFFGLTIIASLYKKRVKKLEASGDEESDTGI